MYRGMGEYVSTPLPDVRPERQPIGASDPTCSTTCKVNGFIYGTIFGMLTVIGIAMYVTGERF